jgi:hypothetical protein
MGSQVLAAGTGSSTSTMGSVAVSLLRAVKKPVLVVKVRPICPLCGSVLGGESVALVGACICGSSVWAVSHPLFT